MSAITSSISKETTPTKIQGTDSFSFYVLPQGKPNPNAPWIPGEARPRIVQAGQKEETCWFYAQKMLTASIGKNPPLECQGARAFERHYSLLRKEMTCLDRINKDINACIKRIGKDANKETIVNGLPDWEAHIERMQSQYAPQKAIEPLCRILHVLKKFCTQNESDSLKSYHLEFHRAESVRCHENFFEKVGVNPEVMFTNHIKFKKLLEDIDAEVGDCRDQCFISNFEDQLTTTSAEKYGSWKSLSDLSSEKSWLAGVFVHSIAGENFGFHECEWKPTDTIDQLIQGLNTHGPLLIHGYFGESFYEKTATPKMGAQNRGPISLGGHPIYCWDAKDRKKIEKGDPEFFYHVVVIVGAQTSQAPGGGVVYFADPVTGSDPGHPEIQKIYVISYENLTKHIQGVLMISRTLQSGFQLSNFNSFVYAFYCKPEEMISCCQKEKRWEQPSNYPPMLICAQIDVGDKKSVGVCISPLWETPLSFTQVRITETLTGWVGKIPKGKEFKFVKINADGTFELEKLINEKNRLLTRNCKIEDPLAFENIRF